MSPHLPVTPDQIAESAIAAAQAGAAIVHLHARDPATGRPTQDPNVYRQFLPKIFEGCGAIINITTGGSPTLSLAERLAPAAEFRPEIASLNMGSMNFGMYELLQRFKEFQHDWERPFLANTDDAVFRNTFRDIETILKTCGGAGTRFEIECYDVGHLYTAAHFLDRKLLEPPLFIQTVFGIRGGIGAHIEDITMMRRTADRLFGRDYHWSVLGAGRAQIPTATIAAVLGGNVRVGLEDSLWGQDRKLATNADQVRWMATILQALGHEMASPDEARAMLKLKGAAAVKIPRQVMRTGSD
jgi:uncharacterized protein (DUF849 family)